MKIVGTTSRPFGINSRPDRVSFLAQPLSSPVKSPVTNRKHCKDDCLLSPYERVVGPLGFEPRTNGL